LTSSTRYTVETAELPADVRKRIEMRKMRSHVSGTNEPRATNGPSESPPSRRSMKKGSVAARSSSASQVIIHRSRPYHGPSSRKRRYSIALQARSRYSHAKIHDVTASTMRNAVWEPSSASTVLMRKTATEARMIVAVTMR
jgi:hypothetical protein